MDKQLMMQLAMMIAGVLALLIVCRYIRPLFEVTVCALVITLILAFVAFTLGLSAVGAIVLLVGYVLYLVYAKVKHRMLMARGGRRRQ